MGGHGGKQYHHLTATACTNF